MHGRYSLKQVMADRGLSHDAVAAIAKCTRTAVTKWLAGERKPDRQAGYLLARELGVPIESWDEEVSEATEPDADLAQGA